MASDPRFDFGVVNKFLLGKQHLAPESTIADVVQIARDACGLDATSATTPYLSVFARSPGAGPKALSQELERRTLAKIRCVRGTIYIQPRDWIPAFVAATRRRNTAQTSEYARQAGISERRYTAAASEITALLAGRGMTAASIRREMGFEGELSPVLYRMCDEGLLLRGRPEKGWKDRALQYVLFREALPDVDLEAMDEAEAMTCVVELYLRGFGPATVDDVSWWTGFSKTEVHTALGGLEGRLARVALGEARRPALLLQEEIEELSDLRGKGGPTVNFLPCLDGYLMGYHERERYLRRDLADVVFDRSGNVTSTILAGGEIVGVWDLEDSPDPTVKLHFLSRVPREIRKAAVRRAVEIGRIVFDREARVGFCESMISLVRRPAGSVMSPLKGIEVEQRAG